MKVEERKGLVRGVVTVCQADGDFEPITAYTYWFRHDDPYLEEELQKAIDRLVKAYFADSFRACSVMCGHEWKDYRV